MEQNQHNIYQEESIDIKKYFFKFLASYPERRPDKTASHGARVNEISFRIPAKEFTYFDWNY